MSDQTGGNTDDDDNGNDNGPNMGTLLIVAAILVGISWFVAQTLRYNGGIQDCVMQGRSNCVTVPSKEH